jgi:hypothetical protein
MKKVTVIAILALFIFSAKFSFSQSVGINTSTPNPSAALDIQSPNKGILIPRVALQSPTDVATVPNPVEGLMVFNTNSTTDLVTGYYYFRGGRWIEIINRDRTFIAAAYGEMYRVWPFGTAPNFAVNTDFVVYNNFLAGQFNDPDLVSFVSDYALQIQPTYGGLFQVDVSVSLQGDNNTQVVGTVFVDEDPQYPITFHLKLQSNGDLKSGAASGLIQINEGQKVSLRFRSVTGPANIKIDVVNLRIAKLSSL